MKHLVLTLASPSKRSVLIGQYGVFESDSGGATMEACEIETPSNVELGAHERVSCERTDRSRVDGQNREEYVDRLMGRTEWAYVDRPID